jgi:DNA-binding NarL/FixJ family response regulator
LRCGVRTYRQERALLVGSIVPITQVISDKEWELIGQRLGIPQRQVQVIQAFMASPGNGKPEAIAKLLGNKPSSVKTHIERLYRNLGCHDRVEVVVKVFEEVLEIREAAS